MNEWVKELKNEWMNINLFNDAVNIFIKIILESEIF